MCIYFILYPSIMKWPQIPNYNDRTEPVNDKAAIDDILVIWGQWKDIFSTLAPSGVDFQFLTLLTCRYGVFHVLQNIWSKLWAKKAFKAMQSIKNMDSISQGFIPYKPKEQQCTAICQRAETLHKVNSISSLGSNLTSTMSCWSSLSPVRWFVLHLFSAM